MVRFLARTAVLAVVASFPFDVEAASCGSDPQEIRAAIKKHVESLRALEREAADRLKGLDTRTFDYLLSQARAVAGVIAGVHVFSSRRGRNHPPRWGSFL